MKNLLLTFVIFASVQASGQSLFDERDSIDANNINAMSLVHGDMWWDPATAKPRCFYPTGVQKNISFAGALWMGGYDASGQLHVAAQTYRQTGTDYWPGPLGSDGSLDYTTSEKWAKIWKVKRSEIDAFLAVDPHTETNTPQSILTWPAKGNPYAKGKDGASLTITSDMAPFVDHDGDGSYNPLNGDYPAIRGEQTLWYVFSDNGPTHTETNGVPLKVEVQALVYAYKRGTLIDNVVYYDYTLNNKSAEDYFDFRLALWNDVDLGYYLDDFIGFDSGRRLAIAYNATSEDGASAGFPSNSYGANPPASGITFVSLPGDVGTNYVPPGSFMYFNNDLSVSGNPRAPKEYNNYMRSRFRDSSHLKYYPVPGSTVGGIDVDYAFADNALIPGGWSECASGDNPGDRNFVLASNSFTLKANSKERIVMALVVADSAGGCPTVDLGGIKEVADTAWGAYEGPLTVAHNTPIHNQPLIYPNPAHDKIFVDQQLANGKAECSIYNVVGQRMFHSTLINKLTAIDVSSYPPGVYYIQYEKGGIVGKKVFVKQ